MSQLPSAVSYAPGREYRGESRNFVALVGPEMVVVSLDVPSEVPIELTQPPPLPQARTFPIISALASISRPGRATTHTPAGWLRRRVQCGAGMLELDLPAWLLGDNTVSVTRRRAGNALESLDFVELQLSILAAGEPQRGGSHTEYLPCSAPSGERRPQRHFSVTLGGKTTALAWCVRSWPGWTHLEATMKLDDGRSLRLVAYAGTLHDDKDLDALVAMARAWVGTIVVHSRR